MNTARGAICNAEAVRDALERGDLNGYAGEFHFVLLRVFVVEGEGC